MHDRCHHTRLCRKSLGTDWATHWNTRAALDLSWKQHADVENWRTLCPRIPENSPMSYESQESLKAAQQASRWRYSLLSSVAAKNSLATSMSGPVFRLCWLHICFCHLQVQCCRYFKEKGLKPCCSVVNLPTAVSIHACCCIVDTKNPPQARYKVFDSVGSCRNS